MPCAYQRICVLIARTSGASRDLWCRCHESEQERRGVLEATDFLLLFERDLRLVHALVQPLPAVSFPAGFSLKRGVRQAEFDAYQELHQVGNEWYAKTVELS